MAGNQNIIYIDTGGTFTDAVIVQPNGIFVVGKASTIPDMLEVSFLDAIEDAAKKLGKSLNEILSNTAQVGYGTTAGTNMIVSESPGPKLGLLTTRGVEDRLHVGRLRSAGLPKYEAMHIITSGAPKPLVPRPLIKGIRERVDVTGQVVIPLDEEGAKKSIAELLEREVEGIAVCFLWSFLNDTHEKRVRKLINEMAPNVLVSLSSEVAPVIREYPRLNSTIIDLYIGKALRELLAKIETRLKEHYYTHPLLVMQAIGGVAQTKVVHPTTTLHSGPVGGLAGVEFLKGLYGYTNSMGSDVGGTSFDVTISPEKGEEFLREPIVGRYEIATPMREIITIGAGGGTIAWVDSVTKTLHVGPQSAGGKPGPVCYDIGGTLPTVTDADVVTNRIDPNFFLGGRMKLNRNKAIAAKEKVSEPLNMDVMDAAESIIKIVDGTMHATLKTTIAIKGVDPKKYVLFAFGGAGPTHCAGYSAGLSFPKVIVPYYAAAFSAFGASTANIRHRYEVSPYLRLPNIPFDPVSSRFLLEKIALDQIPSNVARRFNETMENLENRVYSELGVEGFSKDQVAIRYEMLSRYGGQTWEIRALCPVPRIRSIEDIKAILRVFEEEYINIYGTIAMVPRGGMEIITLAIRAEAPTIKPILAKIGHVGSDASIAQKAVRKVYFDGKWVVTKVYDMDKLGAGNVIEGPAIIESWNTTLVVPYSRKVTRDEYLNFVMEEI
jgi:N-methylhydantoinase A/oxoprolinase/acetone carboxylase beta subunit